MLSRLNTKSLRLFAAASLVTLLATSCQ
ncbi:MAG: hypothetical protein JWP69_800, partial [Flaviaesturariibacter sp.]|nr:hypothetical protein [Flaviaesturariibacter sp.]